MMILLHLPPFRPLRLRLRLLLLRRTVLLLAPAGLAQTPSPSHEQDALGAEDKGDAAIVEQPAAAAPPILPTPPLHLEGKEADKQGWGGWYENGLGSNFHSDYPYPYDPYEADSQYWNDYG